LVAALTWFDGDWHVEQPKILGPLDHAFWMASVVFDGARAIGGLVPDLDRHCRRVIDSARKLALAPPLDAEAIEALCREGVRRLPPTAELYIRPMFFAMSGFVTPDPGSTRFALVVHDAPMPAPKGFSACLSSYRRPARDMAPTDAKASCLYPNMQRALADAQRRGFDNAVTFDPSGNVAELATANLWLVKDGVAMTPVCNGTFLDGITRQRVLGLLREDGIEAVEATLTADDLIAADELFSTGNYGKVLPITRLEQRALAVGPVATRARELYMAFARQQPVG
jgi:branched-chain amino acid aminotransferase